MNTISNYCRFIGRLTEDPEIVKIDSTQLCKFTLAVTEYRKERVSHNEFKKKKSVNYFDFEAWDTGASTLGKYCKKGDIVDVVTSARNNSWTDKNGNKKFKTRFRVKEFKLFNTNFPNVSDEVNSNDKMSETLDAK